MTTWTRRQFTKAALAIVSLFVTLLDAKRSAVFAQCGGGACSYDSSGGSSGGCVVAGYFYDRLVGCID